MNRQQSPPLPETLGIIVREYLKSLPERPWNWSEARENSGASVGQRTRRDECRTSQLDRAPSDQRSRW